MCNGYATRFASSALLALLLAGAGQAQERPAVRWLLQSSPLPAVPLPRWRRAVAQVRVGDPLELAREPDNAHDLNAVAVLWRGRKLGYVPRRDNAALAWGLERGEPLRARISALAQHPNPARRLRIEVFVD